LKQLEDTYGTDRIVHCEWHVTQSFNNPDASARAAYYGASATPDVYFDGGDNVLGGGQNMYPIYQPIFIAHEAELSKLLVDSYVVWDDVNHTGFVNVDVEVASGESISNPEVCSVRVAVYENNISAAGQNWHNIARKLPVDVVLTATNSGDTQNVQATFPIDASWNVDELEAIAFVQRNPNKKVLQSQLALHAYTLDIVSVDSPASSVPTAVPAEYEFQVAYTGAIDDDVDVSIDTGSLPAGWSAELVYNSTTYPTSFTIPAMTSGQVEDALLRVTPSGTPGVGIANLSVGPVSGAAEAQEYHTFNGTPAILYVDDDVNQNYETIFENAIADAGYYEVTYELASNPTPSATYLSGFDIVVWNTGSPQGQTIGTPAQDRLAEFMDAGGAVFITSQGLLNQFGANSFVQNYLGVQSLTQDTQALTGTGVGGDPIGDGFSFAFSPPFVDFGDTVSPTGAAVVWINGHAGPIGVRLDTGTFKSVFLSAAFEGVPDPDDGALMERILDWLAPAVGPTGVQATLAGAIDDLRVSSSPNPFRSSTSIEFAVPRASDVSVDVFDVSGRRVTSLVSGNLPAGVHRAEWDGRDRSGNRVASGVYLVRLQAAGESVAKEVIHVK
jgi:hypothetical protein